MSIAELLLLLTLLLLPSISPLLLHNGLWKRIGGSATLNDFDSRFG